MFNFTSSWLFVLRVPIVTEVYSLKNVFVYYFRKFTVKNMLFTNLQKKTKKKHDKEHYFICFWYLGLLWLLRNVREKKMIPLIFRFHDLAIWLSPNAKITTITNMVNNSIGFKRKWVKCTHVLTWTWDLNSIEQDLGCCYGKWIRLFRGVREPLSILIDVDLGLARTYNRNNNDRNNQ